MPASTSLLVSLKTMDLKLWLLSFFTFHRQLASRCLFQTNVLLYLMLTLDFYFQVVSSRWSMGLPTYLASSLEIAVLEVKTLQSTKAYKVSKLN